ncbi:MAG: GIY-YIG nuclease family protein [Chitinophagales bacterium]|nr:GIY-YIG nuclease family protein [Chitinophagales bacterium]
MKPTGTHNYYVYILTNYTKTVLYIGVTNDLESRLDQHKTKSNPNSFIAKYNCCYLVYYERFQYIQHAIEREKELKKWSRVKKNKLIEIMNPSWSFLEEEWGL